MSFMFGNFIHKAKEFIRQCRRVLMVATKPDLEEFKTSVKITGLGFLVIGIIGFIISMIFFIIQNHIGQV